MNQSLYAHMNNKRKMEKKKPLFFISNLPHIFHYHDGRLTKAASKRSKLFVFNSVLLHPGYRTLKKFA
jgi:hypothetical protein